jgi:hypothetical protein
MDSFSIVEAGIAFKIAVLSLPACCEFLQVYDFFLQHTVERFDTSIIVTIPFTAHTAVHLVGAQPFLVVVGSILAATVGVMLDLSAWSLLAVGSIQCR